MTEDELFQLAKFSQNELVQKYFQQQKSMYHNHEIVVGIELFAKWITDNFELKSKQTNELES